MKEAIQNTCIRSLILANNISASANLSGSFTKNVCCMLMYYINTSCAGMVVTRNKFCTGTPRHTVLQISCSYITSKEVKNLPTVTYTVVYRHP